MRQLRFPFTRIDRAFYLVYADTIMDNDEPQSDHDEKVPVSDETTSSCSCHIEIVPFEPAMTPPDVSECAGILEYPSLDLTIDTIRIVYTLAINGNCKPVKGKVTVFKDTSEIRTYEFTPEVGTHEVDPAWDMKDNAGNWVQSHDSDMYGPESGKYDIKLEVTLSNGAVCASELYRVMVYNPERVTQHYLRWWQQINAEAVRVPPRLGFAEVLWKVSNEIKLKAEQYLVHQRVGFLDPCWVLCVHQQLYERWRQGNAITTPEEQAEMNRTGKEPVSLKKRLKKFLAAGANACWPSAMNMPWPPPSPGPFTYREYVRKLAHCHDKVDMVPTLQHCGCGLPNDWHVIQEMIVTISADIMVAWLPGIISKPFIASETETLLREARDDAGCP